jgi:hypothetical protein
MFTKTAKYGKVMGKMNEKTGITKQFGCGQFFVYFWGIDKLAFCRRILELEVVVSERFYGAD